MANSKNKSKAKNTRGIPLEQIRVFGDPTLKQTTREITHFDDKLESLVETMFAVMEREEGIGLAAPQVGTLSRVVVWKDPDDNERKYVFVNPHILEYSEVTVTGEEGCLSIPGVVMQVTRPAEITVQAQGLKGEVFTLHLDGLAARIAQHEIDHLDGYLIIDRTSKEERIRVLKELRERSLEQKVQTALSTRAGT